MGHKGSLSIVGYMCYIHIQTLDIILWPSKEKNVREKHRCQRLLPQKYTRLAQAGVPCMYGAWSQCLLYKDNKNARSVSIKRTNSKFNILSPRRSCNMCGSHAPKVNRHVLMKLIQISTERKMLKCKQRENNGIICIYLGHTKSIFTRKVKNTTTTVYTQTLALYLNKSVEQQ